MNHKIEEVIEAARKYIPELNKKRLLKAYEFAKTAHERQLRKDGSPYIVHPVSTAYILTDLHADEDTLIGALLHDVPEDTEYNLSDIEKNFGKKIAFLVEGITKLSKVHYRHNMEDRQVESLKKLFIHSAQDIRIILIKLADRLHNMSTIQAIPKPEKRTRIAKETIEIYVPVANLLGIWELKGQLEDLCFKTLFPEEFKHIEELAQQSALKQKNIIKRSINNIKRFFDENKIKNFRIEGRKKTLFSVYKKMLNKGRSFHEIYDLIGLRVIVNNIGQCYQALGILHQNFTPKLGRLKDYIAIPKSNGYQSIHTTVFGVDGTITELQIRTWDMHLESEYGVAAHYFYTNRVEKKRSLKKTQKKSLWVKKILEIQKDLKNNKFIENLKLDVFQDRIFVFTPKGDVVDLPKGANSIDFAFHIHTEIGRRAASTLINGKNENLTHRLRTGDIIEIITTDAARPIVDWLDLVHTNLAKNKIKEYLKNQPEEKIIIEGERVLDQKIKGYGYAGISDITAEEKDLIQRQFEIKGWNEILYMIGCGLIHANDVINFLFSTDELIGEESAPKNIDAYKYGGERSHSSLGAPPVVHKVHFLLEVINRVGMLRDISNEMAALGINILKLTTTLSEDSSRSLVEFFAEIRDVNQYEKVVNYLYRIPGVLKVKRLQNTESSLKI